MGSSPLETQLSGHQALQLEFRLPTLITFENSDDLEMCLCPHFGQPSIGILWEKKLGRWLTHQCGQAQWRGGREIDDIE